MDCRKTEIHLPDYLHGKLGFLISWRVRRHLLGCQTCREDSSCLQEVLNALEYDVIPEPPPDTWQRISEKTRETARIIPMLSRKRQRSFLWYYSAAASILLVGLVSASLLFFPPQSRSPVNGSLFWTFFNMDSWNFRGFFREVNENELAQMTPYIENAFRARLEEELQLSEEDSSRLFPLLQSFGRMSKEYYHRYCQLMSSLSKVIEKDESQSLEAHLLEIRQLRESWSKSRYQFLNDLQVVLSQKEYARFLLFSERLPHELYLIYDRVCKERS